MAARTYTFVADTDSLEALRRLRHGWAGWEIAEFGTAALCARTSIGEFRVRRGFVEPGFELSCLVADFLPDSSALPLRDSPFTSQVNEVAVFRDEAVASCEFTDAVAITTEGAALVVRLALRPGWLEVVDDPEQIAEFFRLRGYE